MKTEGILEKIKSAIDNLDDTMKERLSSLLDKIDNTQDNSWLLIVLILFFTSRPVDGKEGRWSCLETTMDTIIHQE